MLKLDFYGLTDAGLVRPNNEDIFVIDAQARFGLVADGMGGAAAGETASQLFAQAAIERFSSHDPVNEQAAVERVQQVFSLANDRILEHVARHPQHDGMGCTAELITFTPNSYVIGHMGDSRTYRWRQNSLRQLTKDHSLVQSQIDQGLISEAQARTHGMRNVILRAVGVRPDPALDILRGPIFSGDLFLLCSDGLTDLVDDAAIADFLAHSDSIAQKSLKLIDIAKQAGGKDNITVMIAKVL
jgi:PPM family protein phosphatase